MTSQRPMRTNLLAVTIITGFCALCGSASGQDALGAGDSLDASPSVRGRLNSQRPSFAAELQFRNAVATGNAPGGLSFRGDLGYRAAGEFTGELGSDSLFAFRRDSLYSGLAGMGIRGTEAVQYQFALTTGGNPPSDLMGNLVVSRGYGYGQDPRTGAQSQSLAIDTESRLTDPTGRALSAFESESDGGSMLGTLRSSSSYLSTAGMQPMLLSVYGEGVDRKPYGIVASNLRGVTTAPLYTNRLAFQGEDGGEAEAAAMESARAQTTINDLARDQVNRSIEMLNNRAEQDDTTSDSSQPTSEDWFSKRMQEIRNELYGNTPAQDAADATSDSMSDTTSGDGQSNPNSRPGLDIKDPLEGRGNIQERLDELDKQSKNGEPDDEENERDSLDLSPEVLAVIRGDKQPVNNFVNRDVDSADVYADHIRTGERLIASERYFDAEERFTRALAIRPGDVTSQIGRIHAQIGAGMVLSGSVNLQSILTEFPQLAGTRYSAKLLPAPDRIEGLIEGLRIRAGVTEVNGAVLHDDTRVRLSSGLLLAYLGYQSLNEDAVADGLGVMNEIGSDADRRLARLLEQIWDVSLELMDTPQDGTPGADAEK